MIKRTAFATVAAALLLAFAATSAFAVDPTQGGYGSAPVQIPDQRVAGEQDSSGQPDQSAAPVNASAPVAPAGDVRRLSSPSGAGTLPFTGFEAGLVALMGLTLVGTGLMLRRASQASQD